MAEGLARPRIGPVDCSRGDCLQSIKRGGLALDLRMRLIQVQQTLATQNPLHRHQARTAPRALVPPMSPTRE